MAYKKYGKKRPMGKRGKKRVSRKPKRTAARTIRRVVRGMAETKRQLAYYVNQPLSIGDNTILPYIVTLAPALAQGAEDNRRIGNEITVVSGTVSGYVNMLPYNATTNTFPSLKVRMMVVSYKNRNVSANSDPTLVSADFSTFFNNQASGIPFQGTILDMFGEVNKERWTLHSEKIVDLTLGGSSTTYPDATGPHQSGTYQKAFKFYFGKHLGKLKYDDSVGSQFPTNKNLFLIVQPVRSDGTGREVGAVAELHYKLDIRYKDM